MTINKTTKVLLLQFLSFCVCVSLSLKLGYGVFSGGKSLIYVFETPHSLFLFFRNHKQESLRTSETGPCWISYWGLKIFANGTVLFLFFLQQYDHKWTLAQPAIMKSCFWSLKQTLNVCQCVIFSLRRSVVWASEYGVKLVWGQVWILWTAAAVYIFKKWNYVTLLLQTGRINGPTCPKITGCHKYVQTFVSEAVKCFWIWPVDVGKIITGCCLKTFLFIEIVMQASKTTFE